MRTQYAVANWKMNLTLTQANALLDGLLINTSISKHHQAVVFAVPFPYLMLAKEKTKNKKQIFIAAQNCSAHKSGAYTGEVSAEILASIGTDFVILGHSERREYYNDNNADITKKINLVLENKMKVIFCCGEPLQIREANQQNKFVEQQIRESLFHLTVEQWKNIVIAYEPIWAIGTGKTASTQQVEDIHASIRTMIEQQYGADLAADVSILYGGSVKANNAKELFACFDVDGGLVGGASLIESEFLEIIKSL